MKVYVDAWIYVTEKFVNVGNIELYEEISRYEKADYPPIPNFMVLTIPFFRAYTRIRFARPGLFRPRTACLFSAPL